jgi:hypothetical protein
MAPGCLNGAPVADAGVDDASASTIATVHTAPAVTFLGMKFIGESPRAKEE